MSISLKRLNESDIEDLVNLSKSIGWDYDCDEVQTVLDSGRIYGHVNEEGKLLSSAAIITYGQSLASIGMVIVNPDYRGLGLGKGVTEACIHSISGEKLIMLISTPEGEPVYRKLGFQSVSFVHKCLCNNYISQQHSPLHNQYDVHVYQDKDFLEVNELDRGAVGAARSQFLKIRINQSKKSLVVKNLVGEVVGFGLGIQTPENLILGPIIASNDQIAMILINELSKNHFGKLRIDIPEGKESFLQILEEKGFKKVAQPPIMMLNSPDLSVRNNSLYGIAAQIFG
ncbi:GNAT family N-acetyltransferase [Priestia megaterium]|uniref:GNAT family N-acetyltransferase n=1 Tax=Priestia megaterium TaxID=1404 RepID=UPI001A93DE42|nr:GNAT family N-acetyltransferase [Priestia megaterium]QSX24179.1 GNAT family N-acetyltransferase [Priestia megaterium]